MKKIFFMILMVFVGIMGVSAFCGLLIQQTENCDSRYGMENRWGFATSVVNAHNNEDISQVVDSLLNNMVFVKGGSYVKGFVDSESYNSTQMTEEEVLSFYISKFEVTQGLWDVVMGKNPSLDKNMGKPVDNVSWDDCQEFISKLNAHSNGRFFRFPTDTEWEYAARGGEESHGFRYAGSNSLAKVGWYKDNSNGTLHLVGEKMPNELGLYDMTGNVREWAINANGESTTCGGDYMTEEIGMLVAKRNDSNANLAAVGTGLRLVVETLAVPTKPRFIVDYISKDISEDTLSFIYFMRNKLEDQYSFIDPYEGVLEYSPDYDVSLIKEISITNLNKNTVHLQLPKEATISIDEVVLMCDGREVSLAAESEITADANTLSLLNKDGKIIYNCFVSVDTIYYFREVELNAIETAVSLLLPIFPYSLEVTSDKKFIALKNLIKALPETQVLATAIDKSIVKNGYFEIDDVEMEFQATQDRIIELTGLHNNFLSDENLEYQVNRAPRPPKFNHDVYTRMKVEIDKSRWTTLYIPAPHNIWRCEMTVKNYDVLCYSSILKAYYYYKKDVDETIVEAEDDDIGDLIKYIVKPIRSSTLEDAWLTWDGISNFYEETWKLINEETDINTVAPVAEIKHGIKMDFETPNDCAIAVMPCDNQFLMMYNIFKLILTPIIKNLGGEMAKTDNSDILIPFITDLLSNPDFVFKFKQINEKELKLSTKFKEILKLTWPELKKFIKKKLTSKDAKFIYAYFTSIILNSDNLFEATYAIENAMDKVEDNLAFYFKIAITVADTAAGVVGIYKEKTDVFFFDLDFNNSKEVQKEVFNVNGVNFTMVALPSGSFMMGAVEGDKSATSNEKPQHIVELSKYAIGETEVTQGLWKAVMGNNPSKFVGTECPVENVSWLECQEFIEKLNQLLSHQLNGRRFRLPTEAEWEYAACGGEYDRPNKFSGNDDVGSVAWYKDNSGKKTHPVGLKQPNLFGLYDMSGNVFEWCMDSYDANYYAHSPKTDPCNESSYYEHVLRGGCWNWDDKSCRDSYRSKNGQGIKSEIFGLRLAMSGSIENGDFSYGKEGFTSDYEYVAETGSRALWDEGKYAVGTNPRNYHTGFNSHGDHTTGTGNMLIVNGSPDNSKYVWKKTFSVEKGKTYEFSAWFISVSDGQPLDKNMIEYNIDGIANEGAYDITENGWERYYWKFTATKTGSIEIKIRTKSTDLGGNDFAIDDIFFSNLFTFGE